MVSNPQQTLLSSSTVGQFQRLVQSEKIPPLHPEIVIPFSLLNGKNAADDELITGETSVYLGVFTKKEKEKLAYK